ncbi:hypothetical protein PIB30_021486 [Stylosanthes scabra]|uniref:B-like cyclin n=1 Tax=Stylosanthes scabra TaxID=79078 RepID=A0ABU6Y942_9FABA|nr:hypothetical protein [Stylosanthes scabra]
MGDEDDEGPNLMMQDRTLLKRMKQVKSMRSKRRSDKRRVRYDSEFESDKSWALRLLSIACLTLAAKMEEHQVPALPEFQSEDYCFENKVIKRMELLVLSTLEWNMAIITPLFFLPYFITKLCNESQTCHVFSKAMEIIFTLIQEVNLMDHRPSVIAAAATLVTIDQHLTIEAVELKMSSIHQFTFLEPEDIFAYYNQIQSFYNEKTIRHIHFPGPSPLRSWPVGMAGSSVEASAAMNKRRRPTFNNDKQACDDE